MEGGFCFAEPTAALHFQAAGVVVGSTQSWGRGPVLPPCECRESCFRKQPLLSVFSWHLSLQHGSGFLLGSRAGSSPSTRSLRPTLGHSAQYSAVTPSPGLLIAIMCS